MKGATACIIQARMTSRRFPGKTMALLSAPAFPSHIIVRAPVLQHVISRAKAIAGVDKVVCAFPDDEASIPILNLCREMRIIAYAGDEDDVLGRYYEAAKSVGAETVMRITADCPFIFPTLCELVLKLFTDENLDYASNSYPKRTFPKGYDCEVFSFDCLELAHERATDLYDREHVTPWMQNHNSLNRGSLTSKTNDSEENYCIDYPSDIERLEKIVRIANG
jgi:spore coat polysaccharide biosynthesis protein SpsF (cytidylyltransferase family)